MTIKTWSLSTPNLPQGKSPKIATRVEYRRGKRLTVDRSRNPRDFAGRGFVSDHQSAVAKIVSERCWRYIYIYIYILFFNGMFLSIEKGVGIFWEVSWFLFTTCFFEDKNKDYRQLPVRQRLWQVLMTMIIILINLNSGFCLRSCPFPWLILNKSFLQIEKLSHSSQNSLRKRTKHVPIFKGIWFFIFKPFLKGW